MLYLIAILVAASVSLLTVAILDSVAARPRAVGRQLAMLQQRSAAASAGAPAAAGNPRPPLVEAVTARVRRVGDWIQTRRAESTSTQQRLAQAGIRGSEAVTLYWGSRVVLGAALGCAGFVLGLASQAQLATALLAMLLFGWIGFALPLFIVVRRAGNRRREIQRNLPDSLDLLVVCVEAGLGLNQAIARMADETRHFSSVAGEEFALVNLEIRAGMPRERALRNLGERTGVPELQALTSMLIQADRFGTSIGQALRVHAETLREKRRQRAEEMAAKTTVKLVFPLVLCVFPTIFVVILGPAVIAVIRSMSAM